MNAEWISKNILYTQRGEPRMNRICKGKPSERAGRKARGLKRAEARHACPAARISI